ncbi:hypothetical protein H2248_009950 [Termitomyces sp. 'cryptogamus']|nr:hypothetical protein H2248_009950 [Termitomyces sp. 'cryptogamus']
MFFTNNQSLTPATPPPASPIWSATSDINFKVSMPFPPPDIPLLPFHTYKTEEPTLFELLACPSPMQSHSLEAGGVLPPLIIWEKLIKHPPPPVRALLQPAPQTPNLVPNLLEPFPMPRQTLQPSTTLCAHFE